MLIFIFSQLAIPSQANFSIKFEEDSKFDYTVVCTDFCGSKIWDATYLDVDLFFEIRQITEKETSFFLHYNSTSIISRNYTNDYGVFNLSQTFDTQTRQEIHSGLYSWQYIFNLEAQAQNISIPYFFLAHAPEAYMNNTHLMRKSSRMEVLEIADSQINTYMYSGIWKYSYSESDYLITVISDVVAYYEVESGIITRLAIEMSAINDLYNSTKEESVIEAIGSFKMTLVFPNQHNVEIEVLFPFIALFTITQIKFLRNRKKRKDKYEVEY